MVVFAGVWVSSSYPIHYLLLSLLLLSSTQSQTLMRECGVGLCLRPATPPPTRDSRGVSWLIPAAFLASTIILPISDTVSSNPDCLRWVTLQDTLIALFETASTDPRVGSFAFRCAHGLSFLVQNHAIRPRAATTTCSSYHDGLRSERY